MPEPVRIEETIAVGADSKPLNAIERSVLENDVAEAIRTVYDPEIPINVYDLGLIYDIQISDEKDVHIVMTLTSPACPVAGTLPGEVEMAAKQVPWAKSVAVELTWDPPFSMDMIPEETRLEMGWF